MPEFTHRRSTHGDAGTPFIPQRSATPTYIEDWLCQRCGRHLAHVEGRTATMPGGTIVPLPNVIRCHRCKKSNRRE